MSMYDNIVRQGLHLGSKLWMAETLTEQKRNEATQLNQITPIILQGIPKMKAGEMSPEDLLGTVREAGRKFDIPDEVSLAFTDRVIKVAQNMSKANGVDLGKELDMYNKMLRGKRLEQEIVQGTQDTRAKMIREEEKRRALDPGIQTAEQMHKATVKSVPEIKGAVLSALNIIKDPEYDIEDETVSMVVNRVLEEIPKAAPYRDKIKSIVESIKDEVNPDVDTEISMTITKPSLYEYQRKIGIGGNEIEGAIKGAMTAGLYKGGR